MQAVAHCPAGDQGAHSFKFQSVINTKIENVVAIVRECDLLNAFDKNLNGEVLWRPDLFETAGEVQGLLPWWVTSTSCVKPWADHTTVAWPDLTQLAFSAVRITAKGSVALGGYEYCLHAHGMNLAKVGCP